MLDLAKHKVTFFFIVLFLLFSGTFLAIILASGYRFDFSSKKFKPTGLLVATSDPDGAQVIINGKLQTATNNTLSLTPGNYTIEIKKEGYLPWQKNLVLTKELVTKTDAFLFREIPDLKPLTFSSVQNPQISPDGTKILYSVPLPKAIKTPSSTTSAEISPSPTEPGLWVMDLTDFIFNFGRDPRQIAISTSLRDFSKAKLSWSPDSRQILVDFSPALGKYLFDPGNLNSGSALIDVTASLPTTFTRWQNEEKIKTESRLKRLPPVLHDILDKSADNLIYCPDGSKILYTATASAEIPEKLIPSQVAVSTQKETRKIEANKLYIYDIKEDRNYSVPFELPQPTPTPTPAKTKNTAQASATPTPSFSPPVLNLTFPTWLSTSRHLVWILGDKVVSCEYDGTNLTTIYSGPFIKPFVFAAPGANKLIILSDLSLDPELGSVKDSRPNLYSVTLR